MTNYQTKYVKLCYKTITKHSINNNAKENRRNTIVKSNVYLTNKSERYNGYNKLQNNTFFILSSTSRPYEGVVELADSHHIGFWKRENGLNRIAAGGHERKLDLNTTGGYNVASLRAACAAL